MFVELNITLTTASSGKCLIKFCEDLLFEGAPREAKEKSVGTLTDHSIKWKNGKLEQLEELKSVTIHEKCEG